MASLLGGLLGQPQGPSNGLLALAQRRRAEEEEEAGGPGGVRAPQPAPTSRVPLSLSPEDQDRIRKRQLLMTGLGILASPGQGLSKVAQGLTIGQQAGDQTRKDLLERKIDLQELAVDLQKQKRSDQLNSFRHKLFANADLADPNQRTAVMQKLLQAGDFDGAQRLNQFESNLPDAEFVNDGQEVRMIDPRTLEERGTVELETKQRPEGTQVIDRGTRLELIDKNTGEVVSTFSKSLTPSELRDRTSETFKRTDKLADDFRSETGNLQESLALGAAAQDAPADDPAAQQTLVIALNKLLDPGSVVRQSEFARVQEIGGFQSEAQTFANRLAREGQLPPEVEQTLRNEIERLTRRNQQRLGEVAEQFRERAQTFGVNPDFVVRRGLQDEVRLPEEDEEDEEESTNPFIPGSN